MKRSNPWQTKNEASMSFTLPILSQQIKCCGDDKAIPLRVAVF